LKNKAAQVKEAASEGLEKLKDAAIETKETLAKKAEDLKEQAEGMAEQRYQKLKESAKDAKETAQEKGQEYKETLKAKAGLDPKEHTIPQLKEQFGKKTGLDTEHPIDSIKEKVDEAAGKAKDTLHGVAHDIKGRLEQKADAAKEALHDAGSKIRDWAEAPAKDSDMIEEERLTLKQLILRMGHSPSELISNNDFMTFYDENGVQYQRLTPAEKAVVNKVVKKYLSWKEREYMQEFKQNIGLEEKPLGTKLKDNIKGKIDNVKQNFKDSIGLGDKSQRKAEL